MMGGMARSFDAYNTTDAPVTIDDEGRQIAGGEHGKVDPDEPLVGLARDRGALIFAEDRRSPDDEVAPDDAETRAQAEADAEQLLDGAAAKTPSRRSR